MKRNYNKIKKSQQQLHRYRNMVKYKIGYEDTDDDSMYSRDLQGTNDISDDINLIDDKDELKVQKPPLAYRAKEFFESYFTQLLIGALIGLAGWNIGLQIGQAVQNNKIQTIEEDIKKLQILVEDKYIRKDIYDIQIENMKEKIKDIEEEIKAIKNKSN